MQNGYLHLDRESSAFQVGGGGGGGGAAHKKLLIVLSNIGFCKDELSHGLYNKYKHIWLQYRLVIAVSKLSCSGDVFIVSSFFLSFLPFIT